MKLNKGNEVLPKFFIYSFIILNCIFAVGIIWSVVEGKFYLLPLFIVAISNTMIISLKRKVEIYEKGIKYGFIFAKWNEIERVEWKNGILKIKIDKVIGRIRIKDKNKRIKEIIEKCMNMNDKIENKATKKYKVQRKKF